MKAKQTQTALPRLTRMNHPDKTTESHEKRCALMAAYHFYIETEEPLE